MKLSEHFTLEEFTRSQTAVRKGIDNTPEAAVVSNLKTLCLSVLEPLRLALNRPIRISSGYRCVMLNVAIGGSSGSHHIYGQAADITVPGMEVEDLYQFIRASGIPYTQLIQEFNSWVHVSYRPGELRRENLRAEKRNGRTVYSRE